MKIFLVGMPGSGKSTIGNILSAHLDFTFIDMDDEIEKRTGKSISDIFTEEGEKHFRFLETQLLKMITERDSIVVATGGGVPAHSDNMKLINSTGVSFYLRTSPDQLIENLGESIMNRPLLKDENPKLVLETLLGEREKFYTSAHHTIDMTTNPREAVEAIATIL